MKLALATETPEVTVRPPVALLSGTFEERLEKAKRFGYDGVELMVARPEELDGRELCAQLRSHGLEVAAVASGPAFMQDRLTLLSGSIEASREAAARLKGMIELAGALEAPLVTIGSFRGRLEWAGGAAALPALRDTLLEAAGWAAGLGVRLALEPLNRYETDLVRNSEEGLHLLAETAHPCLGLLLDTFHMNIEEASVEDALTLSYGACKLFHLHLGDSNRLPPGQGHFDFAGLVQILQALGYGGYLSAELLPLPNPDEAGRLTIEHIRHWL
jgi:sugar phosphate isomerase/epimerase